MRKDLFRSVKNSMTRFISIVAIIALGISFFVGMKSASPDMKKTANDYFCKNNLMDIEVYSSIGFTSEEIEKISAVEGIRAADGVKSADTLIFVGENGIVNASNGAAMACRVMSMDFKRAADFCESGSADDSYINRIDLVDGRFPEKKNECVVDSRAAETYSDLSIGSVITLVGDGVNLNDTFNTVNYKIVGTVSSPMYISFERGTTAVASGTLGMYLYVSENCFSQEYYTGAYAVIDNKENYDVYSDEYRQFVEQTGKKIEAISQPSITSRLADIKAEYTKKIKDGEASYKTLENETKKELEAALKKIDDIQDYIDNGGGDIASQKKQLESRVKSAEAQLAASKESYNASKTAYEKDKAEARDKDNEFTGSEKAKQIYNDYLRKQQADRKEIDKLKSTLETYKNNRDSAKSSWDRAESNYQSACRSVENKETDLNSAKELLSKYQKQKDEWTEESTVSLDTINARIREYTTKTNTLSKELENLKTKRTESDNTRKNAESAYNDAVSQVDSMEITIREREQTYAENQVVLSGYADDIRRLEEGKAALTIFKNQISRSEKALLASKIAITESQLRLYYEESTGKQNLTAAEANLKAAKTRLETAEANYAKTEHDVRIQLSNAQGDIEKAKLFLDELNSSVWTISYQNELQGHESYGQSLENINAIANVFPVFFFVIAAFMCLATMTRMVQEERMQLGTLKALGYGNSKILLKYYMYASLACAAGSAAGIAAGTFIFPKAVDSAYGMMYNLPPVKIRFNLFYILCGVVFSFAVTLIATRFACRSELKIQAAHLMRPKTPLPGKRIFIERFSTIWNTLSFGSIVTMRNMFRNKRRMVMTIAGVASCATLILSAFGLSNSVDKIISAQYGEDGVAGYDLTVTLDEAQIPNESETLEEIKKDIRVKNAMLLVTQTMTAFSPENPDGANLTAHVVTPEKTAGLSAFYLLRSRTNHNSIELTDDGAVISEKLSSDTGVKKGGTLILRNTNGYEYPVTVSAVTENYLEHYIYISPVYHVKVFGEAPEYKNIVLDLENFTVSGDEQNLADDLLAFNNVTGISSTDIMIESFNAVIDRLDVVIIIFIVSAGLLALIILYNLTNISVQERLREIATIKVLGFTDSEITSYVYRENIFLTAVGILAGLIGGTILHRAVINIAEVNVAMFGREIYWWSYLLTIIMTAAFAAGVCFLVHRKLQKLDTVSALKSVE